MTLTMTHELLGEIADLSWTRERLLLVRRCVEVLCQLVFLMLIAKRTASRIHFEEALGRLRSIHSMALTVAAVTPGMEGSFITLLRQPFELQEASLRQFVGAYELADDAGRRILEGTLDDYLEALYGELRRTVEAEATLDSSYVDANKKLMSTCRRAAVPRVDRYRK